MKQRLASKARHLVTIGGTIEAPETTEPLTMKFDIGRATGGIIKIRAFVKDSDAI